VKLTQMRDRLANLSDEARSIRAQVPHEFEPDVERIQQQMHRLGERLSELSAGALYHGGGEAGDRAQQEAAASETVSDEAILLGSTARSDDPWDTVTANALTKFYESGDAGIGAENMGPRAAAAGSSESRPVFAVEPAWLDRRFAEVAERIEQSLAEIHPESSLLTIGRRFDQLEMRMASALRGVAMRTDLEELRIAEAQIEDIGAQLDQLRRQLGRLDTIDAHLTTLTEQLSDDRLAKLFQHSESPERDNGRWDAIDRQLVAISSQLSRDKLGEIVNESVSRNADLEGLADAAAQKAAAHFADQGLLQAHARDLGEVRGLLQSLINERRSSDENNASMLDTMQQAIVRVLDRIDALEQSGVLPEAAPAAVGPSRIRMTDAAKAATPEPEMTVSEPEPAQPEYYVPPQTPAAVANRDDSFLPEEPVGGFQTASFDLEAAFADERELTGRPANASEMPAPRMNVLRHDFIADAHRAKLKAASKVDGMGDLGQTRMTEGGASAEEIKPVPAPGRARRSFFKSPRVLMSILTLLAIIPAAVFFMPRTRVDNAGNAAEAVTISPAADHGASAAGTSTHGEAAPASPAIPEQDGTGAPLDGMPSRQSQQVAPDGSQDAGSYQDVGVSGSGGNDRMETASLPDGITMEPDAEPAAGRLVTRHRDGRTSVVSGGPGVSATPAGLMQERVLRENGVDTGSIEGQVDGDKALPPATVGPFSLRLAAAQGKPSAQYEVGARLAEGKGPDQDLKAAAKWFLRSATSGFAMAQFRLGTLYERGVGVKTDIARAKVWYSRAAEQGNVKAMHNLAVLLAGRGGAKPDYDSAVRWFTEAAERGLADSQFNLAVLYENGLGVAKDDKEAYKWLLLAAKSGDDEATSRRDVLKARLSKEDLAEVEAAEAAWRSRPIDQETNDSGIAGQAWQRRGIGPSNG
jgi:localization factor PodJL